MTADRGDRVARGVDLESDEKGVDLKNEDGGRNELGRGRRRF